jgi:putative transposase
MIDSVLKLKFQVTTEGEAVIDGQSRILNWTYNHLLDQALSLKQKYKDSGDKKLAEQVYSQRGLRNLLPALKKQYPFLKSVHSSPLKNAALRLSDSIGAHQKSRNGKRKGKKTGWPRFRSWKRKYFSLLYDEPKKGFKLDARNLTISCGTDENGGRIHVQGTLDKSPLDFSEAEIRNLRITKELGIFYAIFTVRRQEITKKPIKKVIALDPNHKNLAYGVGTDGIAIEIKNLKFLKDRQKAIDLWKGKRDRCLRKSIKVLPEKGKPYWLPSRKWQKCDNKLENEYRKRRDQTKSFLFSVSHYLCKRYDIISVGDYTPRGGGLSKGMRRAMNNESLIGRFKETLKWVALKSGKLSDEWAEYNSTKTCHRCGFKHAESLNPSIRQWQCPDCKFDHIRDENAALNGLERVFDKHKIPGSGCRSLKVKVRYVLQYNGAGFDSFITGVR